MKKCILSLLSLLILFSGFASETPLKDARWAKIEQSVAQLQSTLTAEQYKLISKFIPTSYNWHFLCKTKEQKRAIYKACLKSQNEDVKNISYKICIKEQADLRIQSNLGRPKLQAATVVAHQLLENKRQEAKEITAAFKGYAQQKSIKSEKLRQEIFNTGM